MTTKLVSASTPQRVQRTYFVLLLFNTLASSFIWGVNTLFLLDAGLSNFEAFAANAFFTVGQVLFEVPTGVVADTLGRRMSYLLGAFTLSVATALYLWLWYLSAPFWLWAIVSLLLGLGFTFFSGAVEAWLVDALQFTGFQGSLDVVFAQGEVVAGIAMLAGSLGGGIMAQVTNISVPFLLRSTLLAFTFVIAFLFMKDLGFTPHRDKSLGKDIRHILDNSITYGLKNPPVKWLMLSAIPTTGISFYVFYALQPYLLQLYGDVQAYGIAGLVAAVSAGAQIVGGMAASTIRGMFQRRTSLLFFNTLCNVIILLLIGLVPNFWGVLILVFFWGLVFAATLPTRQAYLNALIPSAQRATVLSFDNLIGSSGGIVIQPILGRVADLSSYATSFMIGATFQTLALPFLLLARREKTKADVINKE